MWRYDIGQKRAVTVKSDFRIHHMLVLWQLGRVVINMMLLFPLTQLVFIPGNWGLCVFLFFDVVSGSPSLLFKIF